MKHLNFVCSIWLKQSPLSPNYVIFLTDGLPTEGEQNEAKIVAHTKETNGVRARIFPFGVGYDLNSRLLDKLARANHGQSEFVQPNENIEDRVSRLYRRIESPVLTDVKIEFSMDEAGNSSPVNRLYPRENYDLFEGDIADGDFVRHIRVLLHVQPPSCVSRRVAPSSASDTGSNRFSGGREAPGQNSRPGWSEITTGVVRNLDRPGRESRPGWLHIPTGLAANRNHPGCVFRTSRTNRRSFSNLMFEKRCPPGGLWLWRQTPASNRKGNLNDKTRSEESQRHACCCDCGSRSRQRVRR